MSSNTQKKKQLPGTMESELQFVREITLEAIKLDKVKDAANLMDKAFGMVREHLLKRDPEPVVVSEASDKEREQSQELARSDREKHLQSMLTDIQKDLLEAKNQVAKNRATALSEMPELVAPWPTTYESAPPDRDYDLIAALRVLPEFKELPERFGEKEYSAIRLNPQTVALSIEHYGDFQEAVVQCLDLRAKVVTLEAAIVEASRRHVAVETLAVDGFTAYRTDGVEQEDGFFVESMRCDCPDIIKESLTEALEDVARQVRSGADWYTTEATPSSKPYEIAQPAKEFKVGQVWECCDGYSCLLDRVDKSGLFPISGHIMLGGGVKISRIWTAEGTSLSGQTSLQDLRVLITDVVQAPSPEITETAKEFKIGQVWEDYSGFRYVLDSVTDEEPYPIRGHLVFHQKSTGIQSIWTSQGKVLIDQNSKEDLKEMILDVLQEPESVVVVPEPGPLVAVTGETTKDEDIEMPF